MERKETVDSPKKSVPVSKIGSDDSLPEKDERYGGMTGLPVRNDGTKTRSQDELIEYIVA
jgi:hypothetical protein